LFPHIKRSSTYTTRNTTNLPTFFTNNVVSSRLQCLKFNFRICELAFHTMHKMLVLGRTMTWLDYTLFVLSLSQQSLLVETWIHYLSSLNIRKLFSHPSGGISTHFVQLKIVRCRWRPIFIWGRTSLHSQCLPSMHILSPQASLCACQVNHLICIFLVYLLVFN